MIVTYLLDTNTVSYITRNRSAAARERLRRLRSNEVVAVSSITEAECYYGLAKKPGAIALDKAVRDFLAKTRIFSWGSEEARVYGLLRAKLEAAGRTLSNLDTLIAAQAIAANAVLVTNDKAFLQVDGLRGIENWASDLVY